MEVKSIVSPHTTSPGTIMRAISATVSPTVLLQKTYAEKQTECTQPQKSTSVSDQIGLADDCVQANYSSPENVGLRKAELLGVHRVDKTKPTIRALLKAPAISVVTSTKKSSLPQTQPLLVASSALPTVQAPQAVIPNQLASPQSFIAVQPAGGDANSQSQMVALPITNAAGQQQLLMMPMTLVKDHRGVQFFVPTNDALFPTNLSRLSPVAPQVSASVRTIAASPTTAALHQQTSVVTRPTKHNHITTSPISTTHLPSVSDKTEQTSLDNLSEPSVLINLSEDVLSVETTSTETAYSKTVTMSDTLISSLGGFSHMGTTPDSTLHTVSSLTASTDLGIQRQPMSGCSVSQTQSSTTTTPLLQRFHNPTKATVTTSTPSSVTLMIGNDTRDLATPATLEPVTKTSKIEVEPDESIKEELKEFAKYLKIRRLSLGLTQAQVAKSLNDREGPTYSRSAICRFETLGITPTYAQKLKPILDRWMTEAEAVHKRGDQQFADFIDPEKQRRKRGSSFTPKALEYFIQPTFPS